MSTIEHKSKFHNPPALYRTAPLWIWNDDMNEQIITNQLEQLQQNGFGGAFVHPRPGMITTYLTDEWFSLWAFSLREAKRLGLKLYMYDENTYPSGYGGGHVTSELPDSWATGVALRMVTAESKEHLQGSGRYYGLVKAYAYREKSDKTIELYADLTDLPKSEWASHGDHFALFELTVPQPLPWLAGFAYPDLLRPEVAKKFIETTYEPYKDRFGEDFGDVIPAVFTDEPRLAARNLWQQGIESTAFSYWFNMQFQQLNGYDLTDYLPYLFFEQCHINVTDHLLASRDPLTVRYDYYETMRQLWIENFIAPLSDWCKQAGIHFTGHFLEHSWPHAKSSPAIMSLYEYMDWPGIDMLNTYLLKEDGTNPLLLTIREAHSVANQLGKERVICEAYGAGGWDASFADFKRIGDWLLVNGVNLISQHLTFSTIAGARKRDHPPSFDWRQPWWNEFKSFNEYQGRVSYMISQGKAEHRILLLHPTTTAFLELAGPSHPSMLKGHIPKHPDMSAYVELIQQLSDNQFDFDLGEEYIMERHAKVVQQPEVTFQIGNGRYDVVLVSGCMKNMKASTVSLLESYLAAGGKVVSISASGFRIDAKEDQTRVERLLNHPRWMNVLDFAELERTLHAVAAPRVEIEWENGSSFPPGFHHLRKSLGAGKALYFIVNASNEMVKGKLKLTGKHVEEWDAFSGNAQGVYYDAVADQLRIPIELEPAQSKLFIVVEEGAVDEGAVDLAALHAVSQNGNSGKQASELQCQQVEKLPKFTVEADRSNVLVIDHCDLDVAQKRYERLHVLKAQQHVFKHHGFQHNPWAEGVQFKERLLERNAEFGPGTGYDAHYRFHVGALPKGKCPSLQVAVEWAEYVQLSVNGVQLQAPYKESNMDHRFGEWDISKHVRQGENVITVSARPFQLFAELEAIYVRGDFTVEAVAGEWQLMPQEKTLTLGSWKEQGLPFYDGSVNYRTSFSVDLPAEQMTLHVPSWNGAVISVVLNGQDVGLIGVGNAARLDVTHAIQAGKNELTLKVCGTLKNVYGPHFDPARPRNTAWPGMWNHKPDPSLPLTEQYDLIDYGLFADIELEYWGNTSRTE